MKNIEIGKVYMMGFSSCGATPCFVLKKVGGYEGSYWVSIPNSIAPMVVNSDLLFEVDQPMPRKEYKVLIKYWSATVYAWCLGGHLKGWWSVDDNNNIFTFELIDDMIMFIQKWPNDIVNIVFDTEYYAKSK